MPAKNKVFSVVLDADTMKQVKKLQKKTDTFSRSEMLRNLIKRGLESSK